MIQFLCRMSIFMVSVRMNIFELDKIIMYRNSLKSRDREKHYIYID